MGSYVPNTPEERQEMLQAIGLHDFRELYGDVPRPCIWTGRSICRPA